MGEGFIKQELQDVLRSGAADLGSHVAGGGEEGFHGYKLCVCVCAILVGMEMYGNDAIYETKMARTETNIIAPENRPTPRRKLLLSNHSFSEANCELQGGYGDVIFFHQMKMPYDVEG